MQSGEGQRWEEWTRKVRVGTFSSCSVGLQDRAASRPPPLPPQSATTCPSARCLVVPPLNPHPALQGRERSLFLQVGKTKVQRG